MEKQIYDTIIIGGGIAGLTSAAYLSRGCQKILLIEKNQNYGGLVSSFLRDGYHFEAGVRALESAGIIIPMLKDLKIDLDLVHSNVTIGIENTITHIDDYNSIQDYRNQLVNLYPESKEDVNNFIKTMLKIMKLLKVLYGIENPLFKDLKRDWKYIFKTLLPWLPKFILTVDKINKLNKPYEKQLEELIKNPSLRDIIGQHFFKGTPTFFALSYFSLYLDYFYPIGGVGKLSDSLVNKIIEFGGELKSNTIINQIFADENYILDDKNRKYYYKNLIWAADLKTFYNITNLGNIAGKIKTNFENFKRNIIKGKGCESVFTLYLEVDLPLSYFREIAHGHFFYSPSRKGLGEIHRSELDKMLLNWHNVEKEDVYSWINRFLEFNTFEISIPGLKDSSLVPENKTGVIVSFIIGIELFQKLQESGWYIDFKNQIEVKIIDILSKSVYPKLKDNIETHFSFTPINIKNRIGSSDGSIVGWSFDSFVPVVHKIQKSDKSVLTPIPNIFQAGQWAYSPAGVPMSILTGKLAADRICKKKEKLLIFFFKDSFL